MLQGFLVLFFFLLQCVQFLLHFVELFEIARVIDALDEWLLHEVGVLLFECSALVADGVDLFLKIVNLALNFVNITALLIFLGPLPHERGKVLIEC